MQAALVKLCHHHRYLNHWPVYLKLSMQSHQQTHLKSKLRHWTMGCVWHRLNGSGNFVPLEVSKIEPSNSPSRRYLIVLCFFILLHDSVVINSGPRYEIAYPNGVSHFLEKLAFHVCIAEIFSKISSTPTL